MAKKKKTAKQKAQSKRDKAAYNSKQITKVLEKAGLTTTEPERFKIPEGFIDPIVEREKEKITLGEFLDTIKNDNTEIEEDIRYTDQRLVLLNEMTLSEVTDEFNFQTSRKDIAKQNILKFDNLMLDIYHTLENKELNAAQLAQLVSKQRKILRKRREMKNIAFKSSRLIEVLRIIRDKRIPKNYTYRVAGKADNILTMDVDDLLNFSKIKEIA